MDNQQFENVFSEAVRLLGSIQLPSGLWSIENYKGIDLGLGFFVQERKDSFHHDFQTVMTYLDQWASRIESKLHLVDHMIVKQHDSPKCVTVEVVLKVESQSKEILPNQSIWDRLPQLFKETNGDIKCIAQQLQRSTARVRQKVKELKLKRSF